MAKEKGMDTIIYLIHGFNDPSKGELNVDKTAHRFEALGYKTDKDTLDYGNYNIFAVRMRRHEAVLRIAHHINNAPEDARIVLLTYSNGANYAMLALPYIFRKVTIVHCSPALYRKVHIPENVEAIWFFHIGSDFTVWLASLLRFHPWGRAGAVGYQGDDPRFPPKKVNKDYTDIGKKHGGMFANDEILDYLVDHVDRLLKQPIGDVP